MAKIKLLTKKPKKTKITSVTIRENRNKDFSPSWADIDSMTSAEYLLHFQTSMQYYNVQFNSMGDRAKNRSISYFPRILVSLGV